MSNTTLYDVAQNWSDAQWARFLQCDKKEIPSIRKYMNTCDKDGPSCCIIEQTKKDCYVWFYFKIYTYSSKPFATYDEAENFAKNVLMRWNFNKTQQKIFNVPQYAMMMMKIRGAK